MNHELAFATLSRAVRRRPEERGAIVSKWILDSDGDPDRRKRAYD